MPELTPAQERAMQKREARSANLGSDKTAAQEISPVPLPAMLAEGPFVLIGTEKYEVAGFPLSKLAQAGKLIAQCPDMLVTAALSAEDGQIDAARVTEVTNRLMTQAKALSPQSAENLPQLDDEMVGYALSTLALEVSDEQAAAMVDLSVLALSRRHPGLTAEDIADELDIQTFFAVLCRIFQANQALKKRF